MTHQFGNYVLQRTIAIVADPDLRKQILESIKLLSSSLQQTKHGQKVLSKLQKSYPHVFNNVGASASNNSNSGHHQSFKQNFTTTVVIGGG